MTTTSELREALQAVEPGMRSLDVDALRGRARRVRRNQRIAGAIGCAAVVAAGTAAPTVIGHLPDRGAEAALPTAEGPDKAGGAYYSEVHLRTSGALPTVSTRGKDVPVSATDYRVWLDTPGGGGTEPQFCAASSSTGEEECTTLHREGDGVAGGLALTAGKGRSALVIVGESPIKSAAAISDGTDIPVRILDLGQGYAGVVASVPKPDPGLYDPKQTGGVHVWGFDGQWTVLHYGTGTPNWGVPRTVAEARTRLHLMPRIDGPPASSKRGLTFPLLANGKVGLGEASPACLEITWGEGQAECAMLDHHDNGWLLTHAWHAPKGSTDVAWLGAVTKPVASVVAADGSGRQVPITIRDLGDGVTLAIGVTADTRPVTEAWAFDERGQLIAFTDRPN